VKQQTLGDMLVAANLIDEVQMKVALAEQKRTGRRFGSTLIDLKFIDENVLTAFLSKQVDIPCISLLHVEVPRKMSRKLPRDAAISCQAIPIRIDDGCLEVAMVDPTDPDLIERLEAAAGMPIIPLIAPQSSIQKMIGKIYEDDDDTQVSRSARADEAPNNPMFLDLIEELEKGDFEARLDRMEEGLNQIWTLLEKVLRQLEASDRTQDRR
jgi:MSHA biogenesis protein MshE